MDNKTLLTKLSNICLPHSNYMVFSCEDGKCYFGKDKDGNVVYMIDSTAVKLPPLYQETKSLLFAFNKKCSFIIDEIPVNRVIHMLSCKEKDAEKISAFIRLTRAFSFNDVENDQYYFAKLFSSLSSLFDKEKCVSEMELQGLFAELFIITYLHSFDCDVAPYWQSKNKMKFDFSINEKKRIEIKSTTKPFRAHHFKHDQLLCDLYDIKVASIMLQKNDCGMSLGTLVEDIRTLFANDYALLLHMESVVSHIDEDMLYSIKYDCTYLKNNIKFFDAKNIPHFSEKSPDGVYNAEYDCTLDNVPEISMDRIKIWIRGN